MSRDDIKELERRLAELQQDIDQGNVYVINNGRICRHGKAKKDQTERP